LSGDTPIGKLTYTLGGADAADFAIDSSTGIISMVARDFGVPDEIPVELSIEKPAASAPPKV
jgi:hypothetical protein